MDAKNVCNQIGIPHFIYNCKDKFKKCVIQDFIDCYANCKTPNPCIECNKYMKFGYMWEKAKELVLKASLVNNHIHMVGWDVAITEEGATLIEGNRRPGFDLIQVLSKKGRKDIMRYCLNIINENEGTNYKI